MKTHRVRLTEEERGALEALVAKGRAAARKLTRARILLKADEGAAGPGWADAAIAAALDVHAVTVERVRRRALERGPLASVEHRPARTPPRRKLDGRQEGQLIALACSAPPAEREGWTLRLLADAMVELEYVDFVSYETVRRVLKKTSCSPTGRSSGSSRRRPTGRSSPRWRTSSPSTSGPMTRRGR